MTPKGRKNHYNIKLLRGYGVSVSLKNNKICLRNGTDVLSGKSNVEEWFVNNLPYEKLVISGNGYITFDALKSLATHNRNVIPTDTSGKPVCLMNGLMDSLTATNLSFLKHNSLPCT